MRFLAKLTRVRGRRIYSRPFETRADAEAFLASYTVSQNWRGWVEESQSHEEHKQARLKQRRLEQLWKTPEGKAKSKVLREALRAKLAADGRWSVEEAARQIQGELRLAVQLRIGVDWRKPKPRAICTAMVGTVDNAMRGFPIFLVDARAEAPTFELCLVKLRQALRAEAKRLALRKAVQP